MKNGQTILFLAVGVALVAVSGYLATVGYPITGNILLNLGVVFIAVVLVEFLWQTVGGHPLERQVSTLSDQVTRLSNTIDIVDASKQVGLEYVHDCLANFGTQADWERIIKGADKHVDLMGRTLFGWTRSVELDALITRKIVSESVEFRWLMMSPSNRYLALLTEEDINIGGILNEKLKEVRKRLSKLRENLPEGKRHLLKVRQFEHVPLYCSVTRVDDDCYVTPYLFSSSSDGSPLLRLKGASTPWTRRYLKEFELVWEAASDIFQQSSPGNATQPNIQHASIDPAIRPSS